MEIKRLEIIAMLSVALMSFPSCSDDVSVQEEVNNGIASITLAADEKSVSEKINIYYSDFIDKACGMRPDNENLVVSPFNGAIT